MCSVVLPERLPDDPAALKALLLAQQRAFEALLADQLEVQRLAQEQASKTREAELHKAFEARILEIYEQLRLARRRMFGPSSESHAGQGWLFNEAEALVDAAPEASEVAPLPPAAEVSTEAPADTDKKKARGKRKPLPVELPRIDVIHDVPEAERTCACGTPMVEIGQEISEQLDIVPMQVRVLRHIRRRYGCPKGDQAPVTAPAPAQVLPKSNASNELLALLLVVKYVDGLPLARFEYVLARAGVIVPRQTLARWVIGAARALQPIANLMRDVLLGHDVIHMDETPIQVLKEPGRSPTSTSQMWVQRGGPPGTPVILFEYDPSRAQAVPLRLLEGWKGHLMADGLESYGAISFCEGVTRLGCWVHYPERSFIRFRRATVAVGGLAATFSARWSRARTPHNVGRRLTDDRLVGGRPCSSHCERNRARKRTSRAMSGETPACPPARLPAAPGRRLLVRASWHLRAHNAPRRAHRSVVLPRRPSNVQPASRFSCRTTARRTGHRRGCCSGSEVRAEPGGSRRHASRLRSDPAKRATLATPPGPGSAGRARCGVALSGDTVN